MGHKGRRDVSIIMIMSEEEEKEIKVDRTEENGEKLHREEEQKVEGYIV